MQRDEDESPRGDSSGPRRRLDRRWVAAGLAVLLVLGLVLAWHQVAEQRAEQVEVVWIKGPECTGADVVYTEDDPLGVEEPWSGPLIKAKRGMRCVVTVEVRNGSGGSVHVDHALLPYLGPGGGAVIKVDTTTEPDVWSTPQGDDIDIDSLRLLDVTLAPGKTTTFDIPLVFRESGCSGGPGGGGRMWVSGFPEVTITALGRTFDRPALNDLALTQAGPSRGCAR